jgi:hypothetical protein
MDLLSSDKETRSNYNVSPNKTFVQLWSDFGLRDYGVDFWHRGAFSEEEKMECLANWVHELYPFLINLVEMEQELIVRASERRKQYYEKNPNGHIMISDPLDIIPSELDRRYGAYEKAQTIKRK